MSYDLGNCYYQKGEYDKAIECLLKCISVDPKLLEAYIETWMVAEFCL